MLDQERSDHLLAWKSSVEKLRKVHYSSLTTESWTLLKASCGWSAKALFARIRHSYLPPKSPEPRPFHSSVRLHPVLAFNNSVHLNSSPRRIQTYVRIVIDSIIFHTKQEIPPCPEELSSLEVWLQLRGSGTTFTKLAVTQRSQKPKPNVFNHDLSCMDIKANVPHQMMPKSLSLR